MQLTGLAASVAASPQPALELYLFDSEAPSWEPLAEPIFFEGHTYDIAITEENNVTFAYNVTLTIGTQDETYKTTNAMPYITLTAPPYTAANNELIITATKEGYDTAILLVTILKGTLCIVTDRVTVQEDESFSVIVTNSNEKKVPGCLTYLESVSSHSYTAITNEYGIAYLPAPSVKEDTQLTVIAVKDGYAAATTHIRIENTQTTFIGDVSTELSDIIPVILAILSVITAIIIVTLRNRHDHYMPEVKIHQTYKQSTYTKAPKTRNQPSKIPQYNQSKPHTQTIVQPAIQKNKPPELHAKITPSYKKTECRSAHIEEIRIHVKNQEKKPKKISTEDKIDRLIPRYKEHKYEWFNGKDDIRYKIDSLTGEINEQQADKWFEGIDEIRSKVDEKLKKNNRKKNDNN